jgi:signal transduction histidine kinase
MATRSLVSGQLDGHAVAVTPLRAGAEHVGDLALALPADQLQVAPTTSAVLGLVAPPLAQALHADRLTQQLSASQGRVVTVLEEERRRMRRDLHDGLGPTLTGIAYSADAAANLTHSDPGEAHEILRRLRSDAADAIAEIRRIVYGLRPRALDELGLVGAIRAQTTRLRGADGGQLAVSFDVPAQLPELPAAVEVVAYRVAVEALTNVARHAHINQADLHLELADGRLLMSVQRGGELVDAMTAALSRATAATRVIHPPDIQAADRVAQCRPSRAVVELVTLHVGCYGQPDETHEIRSADDTIRAEFASARRHRRWR